MTAKRAKLLLFASGLILLVTTSSRLRADTGACGGQMITIPFTDVSSSSVFFCSIAEAYFTGLTNGTTATTYSPSDPVTREQMAAFITRTMDQTLRRGSRRAALGQFWTTRPHYDVGRGATNLGGAISVKSDGTDLWVAEGANGHLSRVRASDGVALGFWPSCDGCHSKAILCAMGGAFTILTTAESDNYLGLVDPNGFVLARALLGVGANELAFDGDKIWSINQTSVSMVTPDSNADFTWDVTNIPLGLGGYTNIVYDGIDMWVANSSGFLKKLDHNGNVLLTVPVGTGPGSMAFDGRNIWVPSADASVTVVRASDGVVLATLVVDGFEKVAAAFDGERIMVISSSGNGAYLWRATDLAPLGSFFIGAHPSGVCSDGQYFWIALSSTSQLARF